MSGAPKFSPGVVDYDRMSARYQSGRALSQEAAKTWHAVVAPYVAGSRRRTLVDVGAGTGRFAASFARSLDIKVVGIEPSTGMLAVAAREEWPRNLAYVAGTAERIPLADATCDLAWLSHVWHHVRDRAACASELRRVVRPGAHVLLRGTFGDRLDGFPTLFRFWPATRAVCEQLPSVAETVRMFETDDFSLIEHRQVAQGTAASLSEFAKRTRARADTALALISDTEFTAGQAALETAAAAERVPAPVVEVIELLVFRNDSTRVDPPAAL